MFIHEIINQAPSDHVAIEGDERVTYGELRNLVSLYRNQLYEMGIRRGMKVGLYSANRAEFIYVHLAVISLGAVIIPINNSLVDREVDYILKDGEASLLVTDTKLSVSIPSVDIHDLDFQARQRKASEAPAFPSDLTEDEVCAFVYTSGTTGSPKGAMLTHRNLVRNVEQFTQMVIFKPEDKILCVLPMFHCYGLTTVIHAGLMHGSTIVILRSKNPSEIINAIVEHSVTMAIMVPPMYNLLARRGEPSVMQTVHDFISGGAPIPQPVAQAFYDRFHHPVREGYGLTEASPVVSVLPSDRLKYLTVGPAIPGVEVKIVTDREGPYQPGTVGELLVRGDNVMKGYWHREEETKKVLEPARKEMELLYQNKQLDIHFKYKPDYGMGDDRTQEPERVKFFFTHVDDEHSQGARLEKLTSYQECVRVSLKIVWGLDERVAADLAQRIKYAMLPEVSEFFNHESDYRRKLESQGRSLRNPAGFMRNALIRFLEKWEEEYEGGRSE